MFKSSEIWFMLSVHTLLRILNWLRFYSVYGIVYLLFGKYYIAIKRMLVRVWCVQTIFDQIDEVAGTKNYLNSL